MQHAVHVYVCANACTHVVKVTCSTKTFQLLTGSYTLRGPNTFIVRTMKTIQAVVQRGWTGDDKQVICIFYLALGACITSTFDTVDEHEEQWIRGHMKGCQGLPKGTVPFIKSLERTLIGSNICHNSRLITVSTMFTL